jgi:hypothetical protein
MNLSLILWLVEVTLAEWIVSYQQRQEVNINSHTWLLLFCGQIITNSFVFEMDFFTVPKMGDFKIPDKILYEHKQWKCIPNPS